MSLQGFVDGKAKLMPVTRDPRNGGWFARKVVRLADGTKRRLFVTPDRFGLANTRAGAEEAERLAITALLRDAASSPSPLPVHPNPTPTAAAPEAPGKEIPTFAAFAPAWLQRAEGASNKRATLIKKREFVRLASPVFGTLRLDAIDAQRIDAWAHELRGRLKPLVVRNRLAMLVSLLRLAAEYELIRKVPKVVRPRTIQADPVHWSPEQSAALIAAASPLIKDMIEVGIRTGMRVGELRALRWANVDLDARQIHVREAVSRTLVDTPKGGRARTLPMSNGVHALLTERKRTATGLYVFAGRSGGRIPLKRALADLHAAFEAAGIKRPKGIAWHSLRHTYGSQMTMQNVAPIAVRDLLGHHDVRITQRYAHIAPAFLANAANAIDAAIPTPPTAAPTAAPTLPPTATPTAPAPAMAA